MKDTLKQALVLVMFPTLVSVVDDIIRPCVETTPPTWIERKFRDMKARFTAHLKQRLIDPPRSHAR